MAVGQALRRLDPEQLAATLRDVVKQGEVRKRHKRSLTAERIHLETVHADDHDPYEALAYESDESDTEDSRRSVGRSERSDFLGPMCRREALLQQSDRQTGARHLLETANRNTTKRSGGSRKRTVELWLLLEDLFSLERASFGPESQCEHKADVRKRFDRLFGGSTMTTQLAAACFAMGVFVLDIQEHVGGLVLMQRVQTCFPRDECIHNNVCTCVSKRGWTYRAHSDEFREAFRNR